MVNIVGTEPPGADGFAPKLLPPVLDVRVRATQRGREVRVLASSIIHTIGIPDGGGERAKELVRVQHPGRHTRRFG